MRALITDLLDYSRITTQGQPFQAVDLTELADATRQALAERIEAVDATVRIEPLPTVSGDRSQLGQVLQNLLGNALCYVPAGVAPDVEISAERVADGWKLTVSDNGIGIAEKDQERAFTMFARLVSTDEYPGTGMGLAICRKIIERHHGRIWVEHRPEGGSRFCFTLPDDATTAAA